ncbi:uncharacterized protein LOC126788289 [Argentina anserina]|uniref:uncharacterized protein LOC126788289 n=1 Tax=Argentina anserina TaxID=57926 RepID=UPI0021763485|nr:uncharacterized protein LOC126788289 [Potentilla anserina]
MLLSLVQSTITSSSPFKILSPTTTSDLPRTLFLGLPTQPTTNALQRFLLFTKSSHFAKPRKPSLSINASLIEAPVIWVGRLCIFYALLKTGLAGSQANPLVSDLAESQGGGVGIESEDLGFSKWLNSIQGKPAKDAADGRKLVSKWHPTTKGTLRRNYRVPSKYEGRRILKAIASLLSDDDHFVDATSHKGCQIRRETAHGESVCCNNVRALFDELPTPHLVVEITPFPAGSLTENDYTKAEKLERVLRSGPSI